MIKKGAMFGLDARITLVVIASLTMISIPLFYKSFNRVNATHYITEINSLATAYKNFRNDTNYKLTSYATNPYFYNTSELVSLTLDANKPYTKKYNGPYIEYDSAATSNLLTNPVLHKDVAFVSRSYANSWSSATKNAKCADTDCFTWIVFYNVVSNIAEKVDLTIDGSNSATTGKVRLDNNGSNKDLFVAFESE